MNNEQLSINVECNTTGNTPSKNAAMDSSVIISENTSGIYKIVNKVDGKYYIGSSTNIRRRWWDHKYALRHNKHDNPYLQYAWNKYGETNFQFLLVEKTIVDNHLIIEQKYLDMCQCDRNVSYNIAENAIAPMLGKHHTQETINKIISANKGKKRTCECKLRMSSSAKNRLPMSTETRQKISLAFRGKHLSQEHRMKISRSGSGSKNARYNSTIYKFHNIENNNEFVGTYYDFYTKYNLKRSGLGNLIHGKINMYKTWILV